MDDLQTDTKAATESPFPPLREPAPLAVRTAAAAAAVTPELMAFDAAPESLALSAEGFKSSAKWDQLITGFVAAQLAFGAVEKNKKANVQSRREGASSYAYGYADLAEVLDACRNALNANGIALLQPPHLAENGKVTITTLLAHTSGQFMQNTFSTRVPSGTDVQSIGSAITYLRRYAVLALVGLAPEEGGDDDGKRARDAQKQGESRRGAVVQMPQRQSASAPPPPTADTVAMIEERFGRPNPPRPPAAPELRITRLQKSLSRANRPYWTVEFSDKRQALTARPEIGAKLERWREFDCVIAQLELETKSDGRPYILEIVGPQGDRVKA